MKTPSIEQGFDPQDIVMMGHAIRPALSPAALDHWMEAAANTDAFERITSLTCQRNAARDMCILTETEIVRLEAELHSMRRVRGFSIAFGTWAAVATIVLLLERL